MIHTCWTDNKLTALLCPHRKCSQLATAPVWYFQAIFSKVTKIFLIYKGSNSFCRTFQTGKWPTTILTKAGCKRYCKTQSERIFGKMETKRKIIHPSIWLLKAIYNYAPLMVVSITFSPLRRQKTEYVCECITKEKERIQNDNGI